MMGKLKSVFLLMAICIASISFSQVDETATTGSATISENYCIVLDADNPVQDHYVADASALGWGSAAEAKKKCGFHSNNLVSLKHDYDNNQILIQIHVDRTPEAEDVAWWNAYLHSICN